jgi:hypothetical protein
MPYHHPHLRLEETLRFFYHFLQVKQKQLGLGEIEVEEVIYGVDDAVFGKEKVDFGDRSAPPNPKPNPSD